jgi:hypothetical protein
MKPVLIYCASGNKQFSEIAKNSGFELGAQLPGTVYYQIYFADQDWKKPNRKAYMDGLKKYRPRMASVMDWEKEDQLSDVLSWAEEAADYCDTVMIIPKVQNKINLLPKKINGKVLRIGYSVPTKYGGTELPLFDFIGWPIHLLGGSPAAQMRLTKYMRVESVDVNMHMKMATRFCLSWTLGGHTTNRWTSIKNEDSTRFDGDGPEEAFARSCKNICEAWIKQGD